jgi:polysaccharide deacetylase family protein (PEP-CTERM system associated)
MKSPGNFEAMDLLTFDIEDWYHINYPPVDFAFFDSREDHAGLFDRLQKILASCRQRRIRATFFVLGRLLEKRPDIGESILSQGQELALHGYDHGLINRQRPEQFRQELERAVKAFERAAGFAPRGFRAPSWSITPRNVWTLETLEDFGFIYDASLFPVRNFLYGFPDAPARPFFPVLQGRRLSLLEIPTSVFPFGPKRLGYSGGLYFNLWPFFLVRRMTASLGERGQRTLFYFHPWDLWKRTPHQVRSLKARWLNLRLGDTLKKFEKLLDSFPLGAIEDHLRILKSQAEPVRLDHGKDFRS